MKRRKTWWLLAALLVGGCQGARVLVPLPPASVVAPSPRPLAPSATDSGAAATTKPFLLLPTPFASAPPPVSANAPSRDKPAHWPFHELAWKQHRKVAAPDTLSRPLPSSSLSPSKKGLSNSVYFLGGTGLELTGIVAGLLIGGTAGLLIGLLLFVPGFLLAARGWVGSWNWK